ncbi:MAG: hypothetical protein DMG88_16230 [Acidobacteria bacterium]|nr:MAG: hypothetical protein DMG88_16230 [Acidobacteriota bacterium]
MAWLFVFFFISGFCSLLYEIVWLRLAMAQFGVTSALVSIVLSTFMAGLGLGSWASGRLIRRHENKIVFPALRIYALTELAIGASAIVVPHELLWGRKLLEHLAISSSWSYYVVSGIWIGFSLAPWCACMGATIPVAMLAVRRRHQEEAPRSFSYLYLSNVLGAVAGTIAPLFLIEIYGFHGTLKVGAMLNGVLAVTAGLLTWRRSPASTAVAASDGSSKTPGAIESAESRKLLMLLFTSGLTAMGIEVVWIREFTPYLSTVVYAFASVLGLYLASTFAGSQIYRRWSVRHRQEGAWVWALLGMCALSAPIAANPQLFFSTMERLLWGIPPFAALLGFVTPMLVDRWSGGDPERAGKAYAVNVLGCILGPLVAGFLLLPLISDRWVLFVFALPWLLLGMFPRLAPGRQGGQVLLAREWVVAAAVPLLAAIMLMFGRSYEDLFQHRKVLRDHTATIIATGSGMDKRLLINGNGITTLSTITKMMAHLPMAIHDDPAHNALVVCFGMGTTYRSLLSWGIPTTVVELVPSVPRMFWYYHSDARQLLTSQLSHVVIDDGRRYLERTTEQYDVITIDPPPPVEAAGSSLLYSKEFYSILRQRLRRNGMLQQWLPSADAAVDSSVAKALKESFQYVRAFHSMGGWGYHFLASNQPIPTRSANELVQRMPSRAVADLIEWAPRGSAEQEFSKIMGSEFPLDQMITEAPGVPALQDDRPVNEYYAIRRSWLDRKRWYVLW